MPTVKKIVTQLAIMLLLSPVALSQIRTVRANDLSKPYWLRYNPRIGSFKKGSKIKIYSIRFDKNLAEVTFRYWPEVFELENEYTIPLDNKSEAAFQRSFALMFSSQKVEPFSGECPDELKTKADVIRCLGPPKKTDREGDVLKYHYDAQTVGTSFSGAQVWVIYLKRNKVIKIWWGI